MTDYPTPMLRAEGNLTYLEFIRLVEHFWSNAHPDIPIVPAGDQDPATYPSIIYGVEMRKTHPTEPKSRYRETVINDDGRSVIVQGHRFQNIVSFAVVTKSDPRLAEEIVEIFEDFMLEHIPHLKRLGLSELVYARRLSDNEENRSGAGMVRRTVTFLVTTEKVLYTDVDRIQQIMIDARIFLEESHRDPTDHLPRSYGVPTFTTSADLSSLVAANTNFRIGDVVYIAPPFEGSLPGGMTNGYYMVSNVIGTPYASNISYTIVRVDRTPDPDTYTTVTITSAGTGRIIYVDDVEVSATMVDQFGGGN